MKINTKLEIHFYKQDEAAIFLENNADKDNEMFAEALTYNLLITRTLSNLNNNDSAKGLMVTLEKIFQNPKEFFESELGRMPKIIDYQGFHGRKYIVAKMEYDTESDRVIYNVEYKGFGIFGSGIGYYAPISCFVLFRFLVKQREENRKYLGILVSSGSTIATMSFTYGIPISEGNNFAKEITKTLFKDENLNQS